MEDKRCARCYGVEDERGPDICVCARPLWVPSQVAAEVRDLRKELERLRKLAYLGDRHFPDLTYQARLEELVPEFRRLQAVLRGEDDAANEAVSREIRFGFPGDFSKSPSFLRAAGRAAGVVQK